MSQQDVTPRGCLILVTTPIGNLDDLTPRARKVLAESKYIVAEDTRVYFDLMRLLAIEAQGVQVQALHDHNQTDLARALSWLENGHDVVIVSDAGSPIISDPAYPLVRAALEGGYQIQTCPGVSAPLVALELSGLPANPFTFYGFLPREGAKKKQIFEDLFGISGTHIFFEAPHRILETVGELCKFAPKDLEIVVARELTKKFESLYRFRAEQWHQWRDQIVVKGEFVLLFYVAKSSQSSKLSNEVREIAQKYMERPSTKLHAKLLSKILELDTQDVYQQLMRKN